MADPISIIALLEGSISLIIQCGSAAKKLRDVAGRYKEAKLIVLSMLQEVETIQLAWDRIKRWSQDQAEENDDAGYDQSFLERIYRSLECGNLVMSALLKDLAKYVDDVDDLSFVQRSKVAWHEKALQDHQHRIRGQVMAMTLLLQVLDLPTSKRRSQLLLSKRDEFRKFDESAYSIVPSRMSSRDPSRLSLTSVSGYQAGSKSRDMIYSPLSFENDLFTAKVYKRNYRSPFIRSILQYRCHDNGGARSADSVASTGVEFPSQLPRVEDRVSEMPILTLPGHDAEPSSEENAVGSGIDSIRTVMQQLDSALHMAVWIGKVDLVKTLLVHGAQIDNIPSHSQWSTLHTAVYGQNVLMVKFLLQQGAATDIQKANGPQPIHLAAEVNALQIVRVLLDAGASVHGRGSCGQQPIHIAARKSPAMIELLVTNGADVQRRNGSGRSPLYLAIYHRKWSNANTLLRLGATSPAGNISDGLMRWSPQHEDAVASLALIASSTDPRAEDDDGNQVFHHYSMHSIFVGDIGDSKQLIAYLLGHGADINAVNKNGETPLFLAAQSLRVWLLGFYPRKGAKPLTDALYKRLVLAFSESTSSPVHAHILQLLETQRKHPPNSKRAKAAIKKDTANITAPERQLHRLAAPPRKPVPISS